MPVAVVVEDNIEPEPVEFNLCDFITENKPTEDSELESVSRNFLFPRLKYQLILFVLKYMIFLILKTLRR